MRTLEEVVLATDELEAMRLLDVRGLYQEQAAEQMGVSRRTFGRIVESARAKVTSALIEGKALRIEGVAGPGWQPPTFRCRHCKHQWQTQPDAKPPLNCPKCENASVPRGRAR